MNFELYSHGKLIEEVLEGDITIQSAYWGLDINTMKESTKKKPHLILGSLGYWNVIVELNSNDIDFLITHLQKVKKAIKQKRPMQVSSLKGSHSHDKVKIE